MTVEFYVRLYLPLRRERDGTDRHSDCQRDTFYCPSSSNSSLLPCPCSMKQLHQPFNRNRLRVQTRNSQSTSFSEFTIHATPSTLTFDSSKKLIESSNSTGNGDFWSFWKMIVYDEEALQRQNLDDGRQDSSEFSGIKRANSNDNLRIKTNAHHLGLPEPPKSGPFRPPMKIHDLQKHKKQLPRLLHP